MKSDKEELKKYLKTSRIEEIVDKKEIGLELKTNYEALQEGTFPEKLLDEITNIVEKPIILDCKCNIDIVT